MALIEFKNKPDTTTPMTADNINHNFNELNANVGNLSNLETANKNSAVDSINSLKSETFFNTSSEEAKCNFKYNNKDVYCKTVSLAVPNNTDKNVSTGINSGYTIIKTEIIGRTSDKVIIPIPYITTGGFIRASFWILSNQYVLELLTTYDATAYTAYATIYYIKE